MSQTLVPRARVILDNDFGGDPDGLVQLAHHLLSPSVEIPFVVVSKIPDSFAVVDPDVVARGVEAAQRIMELAGQSRPVIAGGEAGLRDGALPPLSDAARSIIAEALRDDTSLPLYYAAGGGLTELATAYLHEPAIADRLTLVWIGGHGYDDTAAGAVEPEFNTLIDPVAASVVFSSPIPLWQVPETTYAQCLVSWAELDRDLGPRGELGSHLVRTMRETAVRFSELFGMRLGETVTLGDSPLVVLTALQGQMRAEPTSSPSHQRARPSLRADGGYGPGQPDLPPVRVFTGIDTRLMLGDLVAKLDDAAGRPAARPAAAPDLRHVALDGGGHAFRVRIYPAASPNGALLVWLHGGAFMFGDLDMPEADQVGRRLSAEGTTVVSVDYTLAPLDALADLAPPSPEADVPSPEQLRAEAEASGPRARFPVASLQTVAAFDWAVAHAAEFGADPERVALGGASAGGNLSAGATMRLRDRGTTMPSLLALVYPSLHDGILPPNDELRQLLERVPPSRVFTAQTRDAINRNYLVDRADDPNGYAFPGGHDLAGLPSVLMINAELDSLRPSGEAFVGELAAAGVDVRVVRARGAMHGYLNEVGHPASELTLALLTEALSHG